MLERVWWKEKMNWPVLGIGIAVGINLFLIGTGQSLNSNSKLDEGIKQAVDDCYIETFQLANETPPMVGNVCDDIIDLIHQLCIQTQLGGCKDPNLAKYIEARGH